MTTRKSRIQCLDRAMDVLEVLAENEAVGVSELARKMGLHVATIHNVLKTLADRNYLLNDGGKYRLGPAFSILMSKWNPMASLAQMVQPHLVDISRKIGETAVATVMARTRAVMIATVSSMDDLTVQFPNQFWEAPLQLATGRLLVACGSKELWPGIIARHVAGGPRTEEETRWSPEDWTENLEKVRREAVCVIRRPGGSDSVAAPVRLPGNRVVASLGTSCPAFRSTADHRKTMLNAVVASADKLTRELNGQRQKED